MVGDDGSRFYHLRVRKNMNSPVATTTPESAPDAHSDYGSDFDTEGEQHVDDLLTSIENGLKPFVLESIEDVASPVGSAHVPQVRLQETDLDDHTLLLAERVGFREPSVEYEYSAESRAAFAISQPPSSPGVDQRATSVELQSDTPDTRSPLERFRTRPKKPLSVTDIVSPAWCEQQYLFNLSKYGRVKATPAMKQGTEVHKVLEEQVHQVVEVEVKTREDAWGLRIWNAIQGLRTLRNTGITREMEIWGVIDGQVINGIIDELSSKCPDEALEEEILNAKSGVPQKALSPDQPTIEEFFKSSASSQQQEWVGNPHPKRRVYITDVKTRGANSLPQGASLRPTIMQLYLYRQLISDLAANRVDPQVIFDRYRLEAHDRFSDGFVAEVGGLDFNFNDDCSDPERAPFSTPQDSVSELLAHNSLSELWGLMIAEYHRTMPTSDSLSEVLQAEFRRPGTGQIIGSKTFAYDDEALRTYVADEMKWWKGERETKGVDIEEAFKCQRCEFADICDWRKNKIDEAVKRARLRTKPKRKSAV